MSCDLDLVLRHCAAVRATLDGILVTSELASVQLAGLEAYAKALAEREAVPTATLALPERCSGYTEDDCAIRNDDARRSIGTMSEPERVMCSGCGAESTTGVLT